MENKEIKENKELTKQDILELLEQQTITFNQRLEAGRLAAELRDKEFYRKLEEHKQEYEKELKESRKEFESRFRLFDSNWGRFIESLVRPGLIDVFKKHGICLHATYSNVFEYKNNQKYYEIDLLAINDTHAVAVEVKTTLTIDDVNDHLNRMQRIQELPPNHFNLKGKIILGAIAGITIKSEADLYAVRKGLYVLTQKGNLLDILPPSLQREWIIE